MWVNRNKEESGQACGRRCPCLTLTTDRRRSHNKKRPKPKPPAKSAPHSNSTQPPTIELRVLTCAWSNALWYSCVLFWSFLATSPPPIRSRVRSVRFLCTTQSTLSILGMSVRGGDRPCYPYVLTPCPSPQDCLLQSSAGLSPDI